jgi:hypothetical protein
MHKRVTNARWLHGSNDSVVMRTLLFADLSFLHKNYVRKMKLTLCFALPFEAEPWLRLLKPKLKASIKQIRLYESADYNILVTGTGSVRMATALGWFNAVFQDETCLINIGLAGAAKQPLYSWHEIIKVTDQVTGKTAYPEMIVESNFSKSELITVPKPAGSDFLQQHPYALADMEGFAFVWAAKHFVPVTHIHLLKWVSDAGFETLSNLDELHKQYIEKIDETNDYLNSLRHFFEKNTTDHSYIARLEQDFAEKIRLTFSQKTRLRHALRFALFYGLEKNISDAVALTNQKLKHKSERNMVFNQIMEILNRV